MQCRFDYLYGTWVGPQRIGLPYVQGFLDSSAYFTLRWKPTQQPPFATIMGHYQVRLAADRAQVLDCIAQMTGVGMVEIATI